MPKKEFQNSNTLRKEMKLEYGESFSLDEIDRKMISYLYEDGRINLLELSKKVKLSREAVRYRVQRLIDRKIILGFQPIINPPRIGFKNICEVGLSLYQLTPEEENRLKSFLRNHPNITNMLSVSGKIDLIITIASKDSHDFNSILKHIRGKFSNIIKDYDIYQVLEEEKYENYTGLLMIDK